MGEDQPDDDVRQTLRDFRGSVAEEFEQVGQRFAQVDARFAGVEDRLTRVERGLTEFRDETRARFHTMETAILNTIRDLSGDVHRGFARMETLHADHEERIRRLEE